MSDRGVRHVTIGWLYSDALRTYGDRGNVLTLAKRAEWRGIEPRVVRIEQRDPIPEDVDVLFLGGGQDKAQARVSRALIESHGRMIQTRLRAGASLLAICGGYQLLSHEYVTLSEELLPGVGVFDAVTRATSRRLTGNVRLSTRWGAVVGFENHAGRTYLGAGAIPFGRVETGHGNNGEDATEGAVCGRAIGTYLHGPLLPRNPVLADWLLLEGLRRRAPEVTLEPLADEWEQVTHQPYRGRRIRRGRSSQRPSDDAPDASARRVLTSPLAVERT